MWVRERERERKEEKKERGFCVKEKVERETRLSDELIQVLVIVIKAEIMKS